MIALQRARDERRVTFVTREPLVYLDQWAISNIARQERLRQRFLKTLDRHGTLMFSWANAAEIVGLPEDSRWRLHQFIEHVGEHWFPLEVTPELVRSREGGSGANSPCFDEDLVRQYAPQVPTGERFTLARLVQLAGDARNAARAELAACKAEFVKQLSEQRALEKASPGRAARMFASEPFDPRRPTRFVLHAVYRELIADPAWTITEDDVVNLLHAIVAGAYCDFLVLDRNWFQRVSSWPVPRYRVHLYSEPTLEQFLDDFARRVR